MGGLCLKLAGGASCERKPLWLTEAEDADGFSVLNDLGLNLLENAIRPLVGRSFTGLFLDHRPMRQVIFKSVHDKDFLNLFCYTGAVSVFAALGGARSTTSVDMSQTYLSWAQENFRLNQIPLADHEFVNMNALEYLHKMQDQQRFDVIFLDPPTFSNSKKMEEVFEVEKDQDFLVEKAMSMLRPEGILYFSNNKRKFKLSENILQKYQIKDMTRESIPQDFHDQKIHHCFEIKHHL